MYLLGVSSDRVPTCPTASGFILELKNVSAPLVRLIYSSPQNEGDPETRVLTTVTPCTPAAEWCPLDSFISTIQNNAITDWKAACGVATCAGSGLRPEAIVTSLLAFVWVLFFVL